MLKGEKAMRMPHRLGLPPLQLLLAAGLWLAPAEALALRKPEGPLAPAPDFDIRIAQGTLPPRSATGVPRTPEQAAALEQLHRKVPDLTVRWSPLTGSPSRIHSTTLPLTDPSTEAARDIALRFLSDNLALFGLGAGDISEIRFSRDFTTQYNGTTHLTIQQMVAGIDVFGGALKINVDREGRVLNVSGEPMPDLHASVNSFQPALSPDEAVSLAAASAGVSAIESVPSRSLVYFPMALGALRLAWDVTLVDAASTNMYRTLVDALDGTVLFRENLTRYAHVLAHGAVYTSDSPRPNTPAGTAAPGCVARVDADFNGLQFFPHADPHADWWAGAARTTTTSNNVEAFEDRDGNNAGGFQPAAGAGEDFSFPISLGGDQCPNMDPSTYQSAAIANLFYWNNRIHDIYYRFGFDEASGNFQQNNFGLGGAGGDRVQADAQDNRDGKTPSLCNSNFSTPADGTPPRMQMFQCNNTSPERDGDLDNIVIIHEYTHGLHSRLVNPTGGCFTQGGGMGEGWGDYFGISLTAQAGDDVDASYTVGDWLFGGGIRRQPYSTNQLVFTRTYADLADGAFCSVNVCSNDPTIPCTKDADCGAGNSCPGRPCQFDFDCQPPATSIPQGTCVSECHDAGEIWCNTLWMARANFVHKYGFGIGADTMNRLVVDGMKLTPGNPTFLDARDAILQADLTNNSGVNQCILWDAFARMGQGFSALTAGNTDIHPLEAFDLPVACTPNIQVSGSRDFGEVCPFDSKTLTLGISNTANGDLIVRKVSRSSGSVQISVDPDPETPVFISPDAHVDFTIRCTPTSFGTQQATIQVRSNDPDEPTKLLNYTCDVPPGDVRVTGSTDFGSVCADTLAEKTISVCNVGRCNLNVSSVGFDPPCPDFVLVNNPFPAAVSPDSCLDVTIRYSPTTPCTQPKSCTLKVSSDDPDSPVVTRTVSATTPCASIDVPADQAFSPEVVQTIGACRTALPFPISNNGACNLTVCGLVIESLNPAGLVDYSQSGVPSLPTILQPGHVLGDGDLNNEFHPARLTTPVREHNGRVTVSYVPDPIGGSCAAPAQETRALCGEGVNTGARVLVTEHGSPLGFVERIHLQRITSNRNKPQLDTVDNARNLPLVFVDLPAPCADFYYHREYGTVSNPIQLLPGSYQVTATATLSNGKRASKTVGFDVQTCDFNPTVVVDF
jgi:hypothetical protein